VGEVDNAPLLGAAILAAVGAGCFDDAHADADLLLSAANENGEGDATRLLLRRRVERAAGAMVRRRLRVEPDPAAKAAYDRLFPAYRRAVAAARDVSHALADLRSGAAVSPSSPATDAAPDAAPPPVDAPPEPCHLPSGREALAVPSILAADFGGLAAEAAECLAAGARWLHVDVCDGSPDAGHALTLYVGQPFRASFQPLFLTRPRFPLVFAGARRRWRHCIVRRPRCCWTRTWSRTTLTPWRRSWRRRARRASPSSSRWS